MASGTISPRKADFAVPVALALAVLLSLYVEAYVARVRPGERWKYYSQIGDDTDSLGSTELWWSRFFAPIHWIDRRLRPHAWEKDEYMHGHYEHLVAP